MAVKFFGQFLIEKNLVTNEALLRAIDLQERTNLKLGEMAVAMGLITSRDIETAHSAQYSRDMKLGDLLVELGMLTSSQLDDVIKHQRATHIYIGEALIKVGALTPEQLEQYLADFKIDQAEYATEQMELPEWLDKNNALWEAMIDLTYKMITRIVGVQFRTSTFEEITSIATGRLLAAMDISGDADARYMLAVSDKTSKTIAKAILREDDVESEPEEVIEDSVMEFVNIVCGNVVAKASQDGMLLEIAPPETIHPPADGLPIPKGMRGLNFPIHLSDGDLMELIILAKV